MILFMFMHTLDLYTHRLPLSSSTALLKDFGRGRRCFLYVRIVYFSSNVDFPVLFFTYVTHTLQVIQLSR